MAQGKVHEAKAEPMGYDDYYIMGVTAQKSGDYGLAAEWLRLATTGPDDSIYKPDALMELAQTHFYVSTVEHKTIH